MTTFFLEKDGETKKVLAARGPEGVWFHLDGKTRFVKDEAAYKAGGVGTIGSGDVSAPMPGKIIKVLVSEGADVKVDSPMVVMEAMKMEYTLKATISGEVKAVHFSEGEQVKLGDVIVEIEGLSE